MLRLLGRFGLLLAGVKAVRGHGLVGVAVEVLLGRVERVVRAEQRDVQGERAGVVSCLVEKAERLVGNKLVYVVLVRHLAGHRVNHAQAALGVLDARANKAVLGLAELGVFVLAQEEVFALDDEAVLESAGVVPRFEVHLADAGREVAGRAQDFRPPNLAGGHGEAVGELAVQVGIAAGEEAGALGGAHR